MTPSIPTKNSLDCSTKRKGIQRFCIIFIFLVYISIVTPVFANLQSSDDVGSTQLFDTIFEPGEYLEKYSATMENIVLSILIFLIVACIILIFLYFYFRNEEEKNHTILIEKQRFLETVLNNMSIGIAAIDAGHNDEQVLMNKKMETFFEHSTELCKREFKEKFKSTRSQFKEGDTSLSFQHITESTDEIVFFKNVLVPICDENNKLNLIIIQTTDETEQVQKKKRVNELLERHKLFMEQSFAGIAYFIPICKDGAVQELIFHDVNSAFEDIIGVKREDLIGQDVIQMSKCKQEEINYFTEILKSTEPSPFASYNALFANKIVSGFSFSVALSTPYICIFITDDSEYYHLLKLEEKAIASIEQTLFKLATLNDQIRNPLAIIVCLVEMDTLSNGNEILEQITSIDKIVSELDKKFLQAEHIHRNLVNRREQTRYQLYEKSSKQNREMQS